MKKPILVNRVEQISAKWGKEVKYLTAKERVKINVRIAKKMEEAKRNLQEVETISFDTASKVRINT